MCQVDYDVSRKEEGEFPPLSGQKGLLEPGCGQGPKASANNTAAGWAVVGF